MKKIFNTLKIVIPSLLLGVFFIWLGTKDLTEIQKDEILKAFKNANYGWILVSLLLALASHWSRSVRWQYTLDAVQIKTSFWNRYLTLLINYFTNLAIPRAGEITRCALMAKYEKEPFEKILGTLIVERVVDLLILLSIICGFFLYQYEVVYSFLMPKIQAKFGFLQDFSASSFLISCIVLGIIFVAALYFFVSRSESKIALKIKKIFMGLKDGVMTIFTMKNKGAYLAHTLFIWICYMGMFGVCFKSLPETANVGITTIIAAFIFGALAMVLTQGGLGAYPLFVMQGLAIYQIPQTIGYSLGWIIWTSQTVMVILVGIIAFIALPLYNKHYVKTV